ncbi:MAG: hypothetical protein OXH09_01830 [Gammaproteobacteria bacterium]|nr:hypothetical protein [Gammaproteobacteria bacterium]
MTLRVAVNDLPRDNAAALLTGICNPTLERLPEDAAKLRVLLDGPELRPLLEIPSHADHDLAKRMFGERGFGALITFDLASASYKAAISHTQPGRSRYRLRRAPLNAIPPASNAKNTCGTFR